MQTFTQELKILPFRSFARLSIVISLIVIGMSLGLNPLLPPEIPLFYGLPVGNDQLVGTFGLIIPPIASIVITLFNIFLAIGLKDLFLKKALIVSALFVSTLSAIAVVKTILLIGYF